MLASRNREMDDILPESIVRVVVPSVGAWNEQICTDDSWVFIDSASVLEFNSHTRISLALTVAPGPNELVFQKKIQAHPA